MTGESGEHLRPEDLEGAMRAAFGERRESVLRSIERRLGAPSRILLHDEPGPETPVVRLDPAGDVRGDGRYEIVGEIATGGVGVIYKGRDRDLGREVALKVLRPDHAGNPDAVARFVEEAQIGGQLQHPGIVPVYGPGLQPDGRPYFSMKLVRGRTLAALLKQRADPGTDRRRFLGVLLQACQAVAYAHSRGVLHRDLKPSNVMVGSFGEVLVVDWGFGKVLGRRDDAEHDADRTVVTTSRSRGDGSESLSGSILGTPAYMPPEQALGHVESLDESADVFALGAILCEILTGDPPYTGRRRDLLVKAAQARLDDAHGRLAACGAEVELVDVCRRCLSPVPEDRPPDAGALADALEAHFAAAEGRARRAEVEAVAERARLARERLEAEGARRARRLTRWAAVSVLLAAAAATGLWMAQERRQRARAEAARPAFDRAIESSAAHAAAGEWGAARGEAAKALDLARTHGLDGARAQRALSRADEGHAAAVRRAAEADARARIEEALDGVRLGPEAGADAAYRGALGPLLAGDVPAAYDTVHVRVRVGAALDHWASLRGDRALLERACIVDPHPFRDEIRRAAIRGNETALRDLARAPEVTRQDGRTLDALALLLPRDDPERRALLERSCRAYPGDLWLHLELCRAVRTAEPARAIRALQVALALRPSSEDLRSALAELEASEGGR